MTGHNDVHQINWSKLELTRLFSPNRGGLRDLKLSKTNALWRLSIE